MPTSTSPQPRSGAASSSPGDRVSGPRRPPRRSERFASLVRVDTINGSPADEVASSPRFDELPAAFPHERFRLGSEDPTVKAIEWLTPFGRGSRVTIAGGPVPVRPKRCGGWPRALVAQEGIECSLALAGVRPEEIAEWAAGELKPGRGGQLGRPGRRSGSRGGDGRRSGPADRCPRCPRGSPDRQPRRAAPARGPQGAGRRRAISSTGAR